MKQCPICKRTYNDETFAFCLADGSLLSASYDPETTLVMGELAQDTLNPTIRMFDSPQAVVRHRTSNSKTEKKQNVSTVRVDDRVIAICINEQYPHCQNAAELYRCTRGVWRLRRERADKAKYAFAVYRGVVKEVYEIENWLPATKAFRDFWIEKLRSQGRIISPDEHIGRYEFIGREAPDHIRKKYVGHIIPTRHKGNPILYFNC